MTTLATLTTQDLQALTVIGAALWIIFAALIGLYGREKGFPFFPLFLPALFPFPGPLLVLLGIALFPRQNRP